jgi:cell division protein FtsZ
MPRIDELPLPAQAEIRAQRAPAPLGENPNKRHMSLLQRLASVGLGRREEATEAPAAPRQPLRPAPAPAPMPAPARPAAPQQRMPESAAEYARRPAPTRAPQPSLDQHGRVAHHNAMEDDQLEIPAFLRRQAK